MYEFDIRFPNATDDVPLNLELFLDAAHNIFRAETKLPIPEEGEFASFFLYGSITLANCHQIKNI